MSNSTSEDTPTRVLNQAFIDRLTSDDPAEFRKAAAAATNYTRAKMREDGFLDKIIPPQSTTNSQFTKLPSTGKLAIVVEKEPGSPAAISVPLGTMPMTRYVRQPRYAVGFQRFMTPKFIVDVDELRTYDMDIRQVLSDNSIKDMLAEQDGKYLATANAAMGTPNTGGSNETGIALWNTTASAINRSTLTDAMKVMPRTAAHFNAETALINNVSIMEVQKWQRDQVGGDLSQDMLVDGFSERKFMGVNWIVTIKTDLVAEGTVYFFANPRNLGVNYVVEDTTMYLDRKMFMIEFCAYKLAGAAIGNIAGVTRTDFGGTFTAANN